MIVISNIPTVAEKRKFTDVSCLVCWKSVCLCKNSVFCQNMQCNMQWYVFVNLRQAYNIFMVGFFLIIQFLVQID